MNSKKLARLLSVILGPQVWLPVFLFVFVFKTGLTKDQMKILLPTLFAFQILIPLLYFFLAQRRGEVSDIDLPKRGERIKFLMICLVCWIISLVFVYFASAKQRPEGVGFFGSKLLLHLYLIILALIVISSAVTFFWKISLHVSLNTTGSILINFLFNWRLPLLYLSIPLVFWARWILKKHTISQLLVGFIIDAIFVLGVLRVLGYI